MDGQTERVGYNTYKLQSITDYRLHKDNCS